MNSQVVLLGDSAANALHLQIVEKPVGYCYELSQRRAVGNNFLQPTHSIGSHLQVEGAHFLHLGAISADVARLTETGSLCAADKSLQASLRNVAVDAEGAVAVLVPKRGQWRCPASIRTGVRVAAEDVGKKWARPAEPFTPSLPQERAYCTAPA